MSNRRWNSRWTAVTDSLFFTKHHRRVCDVLRRSPLCHDDCNFGRSDANDDTEPSLFYRYEDLNSETFLLSKISMYFYGLQKLNNECHFVRILSRRQRALLNKLDFDIYMYAALNFGKAIFNLRENLVLWNFMSGRWRCASNQFLKFIFTIIVAQFKLFAASKTVLFSFHNNLGMLKLQ